MNQQSPFLLIGLLAAICTSVGCHDPGQRSGNELASENAPLESDADLPSSEARPPPALGREERPMRSDSAAPEQRTPANMPSRNRDRPARPKDSWIIFRDAFDETKDAQCTAKWIGRNRFEVKTDNVRRLTADMTRLPEGAPRKGPWIIIIDGQGVELTGFKPKKPGYTGRKRDLVRSVNGKWTVDRKRLYRPGE